MKKSKNTAVSSLYSRIRNLVNKNKISLAELERTLNFSNGIISTWRFSNPSTDKVTKVANYFKVSVDYLLGNTDNPSLVSEDNPAIDIENDKLLTYRGRPIPDDYLDIIRNLMDSDIERGKRRG